jgi:hypothetical protein
MVEGTMITASIVLRTEHFTSNFTLDEMIAHNVQYLDLYNQDAEVKVTKEEAIVQLKQYFPALKRWRNK